MKKILSAKFIIGAAITVFYFAVLAATVDDIGLTDDVDFYAPASISYTEWFGKTIDGIVHFDFSAFGRNVVDRYWYPNHEHPPFAKVVMGTSHAIFHDLLNFTGIINGLRLGTIFLSTLLALLLFIIAWEEIGRAAAVFSPLALLTLPRFFFDSHAETLDVPVACTFFLAFFSFWKSRDSWRWGLFAGVAFGMALATKLNAPFLLIVLILWWIVKNHEKFSWISGKGLSSPAIPVWIPSMLFLGCAFFLLSWPWLWSDTTARLNEYMAFHLKHYGILFSYFGRIYEVPFAPWHAPWVMMLITTPVLTVVAGITGTALVVKNAVKIPVGEKAADKRDFGNLIALCALCSIGTVSFFNVPKYGGVKLFLPFFPFFVLLGGMGVQWVSDKIFTYFKRDVWKDAGGMLFGIILLIPQTISLASIHPYYLSYSNIFIGGLPGAAEAGMERQYYDVFYKSLVKWMNSNLPAGAKVTFQPNNKEYVRSSRWYKNDGELRRDISVEDFNNASYLVLTHEERWPQYPELKRRYSYLPVMHEIAVEGVPLLTVYRLK